MTSMLTNVSAMSAVSALAATQRSLATTENQITTGLRVSSAKDNAAYWSIATSMKTRIGNLGAANDGLDLTSGVLSTTAAGLAQILKLMQGIAQDLVTAQTTGVDLSKIQEDISAKQQGIISAAEGATYNGVNWLVTKVAGTETANYFQTYNTTNADFYSIVGVTTRTAGTASVAVNDTDTNQITQTLGSTSSSTNTYNHSYDATETSTANPSPSTGSRFLRRSPTRLGRPLLQVI